MSKKIVIVGAGQAAFALASKLRALNDTRPITIIGEESVMPYQRPPLSKKYLLGQMTFNRLMFRSAEWYSGNDIEVLLDSRVARIERDARRVRSD